MEKKYALLFFLFCSVVSYGQNLIVDLHENIETAIRQESITIDQQSKDFDAYPLIRNHGGEGFTPESDLFFFDQRQQVFRYAEVELNPVFKEKTALSQGDTIILNLFDEMEFVASIQRLDQNVNGTVSVIACFLNSKGYVTMATTGHRSLVKIFIPPKNQLFLITSDPETKTHYLLEMDSRDVDVLPGATPLIPEINEIDIREQSRIQQILRERNTGPDDPANIDVMIVYTFWGDYWANQYGGGLENVLALALANAQLTLDNSETLITLNLVHSAMVDYTESDNITVDLLRLASSPGNPFDEWNGYPIAGYMDEIHQWRDEYHADLCALFAYTESRGGIAWTLNTLEGTPNHGFSVTRIQQAANTYSFIHELGHNMGCSHHKLQHIEPGPTHWMDWPENTWSAGWRWKGVDEGYYCSVMSYAGGGYYDDGITHTQVPFFSSPLVTYEDVATGHQDNGDNTRTINTTKHIVAAYRGEEHHEISSGQTILFEDFNSGDLPPLGWEIINLVDNWSIQPSTITGANPMEIVLNCRPGFSNITTYLVSPPMDLADNNTESLLISFKHMLNTNHLDFVGDPGYIGVALRCNEGEWESVWEEEVNGDILAEYKVVHVNSEMTSCGELQIALYYSGESVHTNKWFIGEITVMIPGQLDLAPTFIHLPEIAEGSSVVSGEVINLGKQNIHAFDLHWQLNNGPVNTIHINNLNLATDESYQFESEHLLNGEPGSHTLHVYVSNVNGQQEDDNPENDNIHKHIFIPYDVTHKKPLFEVLTSSTCGGCRTFNEDFFDDFHAENASDMSLAKYQMSWPLMGDPYFNDDGHIRSIYYESHEVPRLFLNGELIGNEADLVEPLFHEALEQPAFIELEGNYHIVDNHVTLEGIVLPYADIPAAILHIVLVEQTTYGNAGTNNQTVFHHVTHKMLPDGHGTLQPLMANENHFFSHTFDMSETFVEEMHDLVVLVFIQNLYTREIYQSAYLTHDVVSFNIDHGAENVETSTDIIAGYEMPVSFIDGSVIDDSNVSDLITFEKKSPVYESISFAATISEEKDEIFISPDTELHHLSNYKIVLEAVKTASGGTISGDVLTFTTMPASFDLAISDIMMPDILWKEESLMGSVINLGETVINSFELNWQLGDGIVYNQSYSDLSIETGELYDFEAGIIALPEPGDHELHVFLHNINGQEQDDQPDNDAITVTFSTPKHHVDRRPLFESFASSHSIPCAMFHMGFFNAFAHEHHDNISYLRYPIDYPSQGDPYYTETAGVRRLYYQIFNLPALVIDGQRYPTEESHVTSALDQLIDVPSFLGIDGSFTVYGQQLSVEVELMPYVSFPEADMHVVIIEEVTYENTSTNPETEFFHLMHKMVPDAKGTPVNLISGGIKSFSFQVDMSNTNVEEMEDLMVLVFLQDESARFIYQTNYLEKMDTPTYTLLYTAGPGGSLEGELVQTVKYGDDGTPVEAISDESHHFIGWSDGLTDNPRTDTNVTADLDVEAEFALTTYVVTFIIENEHGETIPDAVVILDQTENSSGDYVFDDIVPGDYSYTVLADNYFDASGELVVTDQDITVTVVMQLDDTGIAETHTPEITIFPNPARSTLHIESNIRILQIQLLDLLGQRVITQTVNDHHHELSVSDFEKGLYFIQVFTDKGVKTMKMQVIK